MLYRIILFLVFLHVISTTYGQRELTFSCLQRNYIDNPDTSLWSLSLGDFVKESSLVKPKFTGGSVILVSAVNGISLIMMSLQISKIKIKDSIQIRRIDSVLKELHVKQGLLACLSEMDNIVFRDFLAISKLPANSELERKRKDSIRTESLIKVTQLPINGAETIMQCLTITHTIGTLFNKNVLSDVKAGVILMSATLDGLLLLANSNVTGLPEGLKSAFLNSSGTLSKNSKAEVSAIFEIFKIAN